MSQNKVTEARTNGYKFVINVPINSQLKGLGVISNSK
jgi:hypothetical protein